MTEIDLMDYVTSAVADNWTFTPVEYDNMRIKTDGLDAWLRVTIQPVVAVRYGFGESTQHKGLVTAQIFTVLRTGQRKALELATEYAKIFNCRIDNGIVFSASDITVIGEGITEHLTTVKSGWYQINCINEYTFFQNA